MEATSDCPHTVPTLYPKPGKTALLVPIAAYPGPSKSFTAQQITCGLWHYESVALTAELHTHNLSHISPIAAKILQGDLAPVSGVPASSIVILIGPSRLRSGQLRDI